MEEKKEQKVDRNERRQRGENRIKRGLKAESQKMKTRWRTRKKKKRKNPERIDKQQ